MDQQVESPGIRIEFIAVNSISSMRILSLVEVGISQCRSGILDVSLEFLIMIRGWACEMFCGAKGLWRVIGYQ